MQIDFITNPELFGMWTELSFYQKYILYKKILTYVLRMHVNIFI
jgi:hypothetical protein